MLPPARCRAASCVRTSSRRRAPTGTHPRRLMLADLRDGVKGKAIHFTDNEVAILGKGVGYYERTQPFSIDLWVKAGQVYEDSAILHHRETENAGNADISCTWRRTISAGR